ncbi:myelin expression factor 2 [Boleophthalmus pectinirostris]|uniref:myelin expression factor 2 n=1 Tax=Boleophthalmus pectinirostris TaxID=150288 RepID=UPI000A1C1CA2|nr:myelin expression factor 2 [Boleophthalmus pectinirostris]
MADFILMEDDKKPEESTTTSEPGETSQEVQNGDKTENEEDKTDDEKQDGKERSRKGNRFHPYKDKQDRKAGQKNRVFISNIPYDMKWQAIKDLMREKVGEVTYVELFKDAEGKSRGCGVVEFKDHEFVKKALEVMNKYVLNGRPLNISSDPDGEIAQRVLQRFARGPLGGRPDMAPGVVNIPPSIANNPNIPPEVIHALRTGRLGTTVFVANLDYKVGWKKLKEVFSMAGIVKRADVKEDKDGRSRGMGMVIFEQPLEAVQAISMFNGQMLFDRQMLVKMDDKSIMLDDCGPQLPRGLSGVGMGLGPGGQPINANRLSGGGDICPMRPGGMDMPGYSGMNRLGGGMGGGFGGMDNMGSMGGFSRDMGRMGDTYRSGMGGMDRDFGRSDMSMNRGFGDSFGGMGGGGFGGGMGSGGMGMGSGLGGGMGGIGMDRMGSGFDRMGLSGGLDMNRGSFGGFGGSGSGHMSGGMSDGRGKPGCQIYVRNLSYDLTWQKLKEKFSHCGQVMYAEIKMENGRSKGSGTVRFDCPESAEKAIRLMNGTKINGREVDVRLDRAT